MLKFLLERKAALVKQMTDLVTACEKEARIFSDAEQAEFNTAKVELEKVNGQIETVQGFQPEKPAASTGPAQLTPVAAAPANLGQNAIPGLSPAKEFESMAEFIKCVAFQPNDQRLTYVDVRSEMSAGTGSKGGFKIPTQFIDKMFSISPGAGVIRERATVLPSGDMPDAPVELPALDQNSTDDDENQMYGGIEVVWGAEGATMSQSDASLRMVSWEAKEVTGFATLSNKLLRNWRTAGAFLEQQFRLAVLGAEDTAFLSANSPGRPRGIRDAGASYVYERAAANAISLVDFQGMFARFLEGDDGLWLCSRSAYAAILAIVGQGGGATNIIKPDGNGGVNIYGYPLKRHGRGMAALGSKGDLMLVDRTKYVIKEGAAPLVDVNDRAGTEWKANKTLLKIVRSVDGGPWLNEPIRDENDYEVSPFVVLDAYSS